MEPKTTRINHRWTDDDLKRLVQVVEEDLRPIFDQAKEAELPEIQVWNLVPGKLGFLVSANACWDQYRLLRRGRDLKLVATAPEPTDLTPLLEELRGLRTDLSAMRTEQRLQGQALEQRGAQAPRVVERLEDLGRVLLVMRESIDNSSAQADMYLEKLCAQFETLLTELRKG